MRTAGAKSGRAARVLATAGIVAGAAAVLPAIASGAADTASGTVIATTAGQFKTMLVVASGKYAGYSLYMITSDTASSFGCTATVVKTLPGGPGSCTGPSSDKHAEWPALTTTGAPVAGTGVSGALLGAVSRPGIGDQVTYAGHPLYLFDSGPGQVTGEGWDEPTLPPWHGLWSLLSPSGAPLSWAAALTTTTIKGTKVLAATMLTGAGWEPFPLYSFSTDVAAKSACTGACATAWPPLLTSGHAGSTGAVRASAIGDLMRADGTTQVTYRGHALYLFANESIAPTATGFAAAGDGNGVKAFGGVFRLVSP